MRDDMLAQLRDDECDGGAPNLVAYDDATGLPITPGTTVQGHPTIGIGRALDTHGVSMAEALSMFAADVAAAETGLRNALPWLAGIDDVRRDALCNMAFQMGVGGVLQFRDMLAQLQAAFATSPPDPLRLQAAADAALDSAWAREMARFGSDRARRIARQLRTGLVNPVAS
jgi:lysozyme